eukprot:g3141.t1
MPDIPTNKPSLVFYVLCLLSLFNFCYLITAIVAGHKCYFLEDKGDIFFQNSNPCVEGAGLSTLFTVDSAKTFNGVTTGLTALAHGAYGIYILRKAGATVENVTLYLGTTLMMWIMLLQITVFWGSQDYLQAEFDFRQNYTEGAGKGTHALRHFHANTELQGTFAAAVAFSLLSLFCETFLIYALTYWKDDIIAAGTGSFGGYSNFGSSSSSGSTPAPYEAPSNSGSSTGYNDL